jgi:hypothetical protein
MIDDVDFVFYEFGCDHLYYPYNCKTKESRRVETEPQMV